MNVNFHLGPQATATTKKQFVCDFENCLKSFDSLIERSYHKLDQKHFAQLKFFKCDYPDCNKFFEKPRGLVRHSLASHPGWQTFGCRFCDTRFTHKQSVWRHEKTHVGFKPFQCRLETCRKKFTDSYHLREHLFTHTGERPYHCNIGNCEKKFASGSTLRKHKLILHPASASASVAASAATAVAQSSRESTTTTTTFYEIKKEDNF